MLNRSLNKRPRAVNFQQKCHPTITLATYYDPQHCLFSGPGEGSVV